MLEALHPSTRPLKVGIVGPGAGTIATYGSKGDIYRFYDINPAVITIANRDFSYLKNSDAKIETALGDARLTLEREPPQQFDVLAIDAFSSDAIPMHLLTAEALAIYRKHMKPAGIIAFHVTIGYLDLAPVVQRLAEAQERISIHLPRHQRWHDEHQRLDSGHGRSEVARSSSQISDVSVPVEPRPGLKLWTDDFNNIVQVLK